MYEMRVGMGSWERKAIEEHRDKNMNQNMSERVRTSLTFAWQSVTVSSAPFYNCRQPPFWLGMRETAQGAWAGAGTQ